MFTAVNARASVDSGGLASSEVQEKQLTDLYLKALGLIKRQELQAAVVQSSLLNVFCGALIMKRMTVTHCAIACKLVPC